MKQVLILIVLIFLVGCDIVSQPKETSTIETKPNETQPEETTVEETKPSGPIVVVLPTPTTEEPQTQTDSFETVVETPTLSSNANLSSLKVEKANLSPAFSKNVLKYSASFSSHQNEIVVNAIPADKNATTKVTKSEAKSTTTTKVTYTIVVTAQNQSKKTYTVVVTNPNVVSTTPVKPGFTHLPTPSEVTMVDGIIFVNKKYGLPSTYNPGENSVAGTQIRKLIADMQAAGLNVRSRYSGFRSFADQKRIFENYVSRDGVAKAETYSARPGFSEHQTGLTFDLFTKNNTFLGNNGRDLPEVAWLKEHAASYGFIVRYPNGKTAITGYKPEPWHLRYIGQRAQEIADSGLTLEEFFNMPGGDYNR